MADRVGQRLGNYRLLSLLGQGGFAEVYLGEHIYLKTPSAVKLLLTKVPTQEDLDAFLKEAQTIARLIHPNIVRVMDFGTDGETPFLVMDYAQNGTLRQRHPRGSRLPLATIISYVRQVAEALQFAHDQKLIHRDIKPENMLVGQWNEVLLSDFGIALITQSSRYQSTQDVIGTVAYMSPEQIQGKPRPASDQYSLAIVVYEWLNGDRPFHGSFTELCTQHMFAAPPSLREKVPTILPEVEQVVTTALAKDPRQRFGGVRAFANALEQASQSDASTFIKPPISGVQVPRVLKVTSSPATLAVTFPPLAIPPLGTTLYSYSSHDAQVYGVVWAPDGKRIASGGVDKTVQVWNAAGSNIYTYRGHSSVVTTVAWSPDGQRIASGGYDGTVQVWNAVDGSNVYIYRGHPKAVEAVAWSPDGQRIASGGYDGTIQVWDAINGSNMYTYRGHFGAMFAVAWSPDGQRIASGSYDRRVQVWDAIDGGHVYTYRGHSEGVRAATWSPDGQRIASGDDDGTVQVWQAV